MIILGLDGMSVPLIESGNLPYLAKMWDECNSGVLKSVVPPVTIPAWASFQTGMNPGKHGFISFFEVGEKGEKKVLSRDDLDLKAIYDITSDYYDTFVFNLPLAKKKGGVDLVSSWFSGAEEPEDFVSRKGLLDEFPILNDIELFPDRSGGDIKFLKSVESIFSDTDKLIRSVVESKRYDFMFFLVSSTDWVQHRAFEDLVKERDTKRAEIAKRILKKVDELVKWLDQSDEELLMMSDHGFGLWKQFYINQWLFENGYLVKGSEGFDVSAVSDGEGKVSVNRMGNLVKKNRFLFKIAQWVNENILANLSMKVRDVNKIDIEKSRAFSPFKQLIFTKDQKTKEQLLKDLNEIPEIYAGPTSEVYEGEYTERVGNVYIALDEYLPLEKFHSEVFSDEEVIYHSPNGIFISRDLPIEGEENSIIDIMPTVLTWLECPVPTGVDGMVIIDKEPQMENDLDLGKLKGI